MTDTLAKALETFQIDGTLSDLAEHKRGHINTTWIGTWSAGSTTTRYIHQKVNHQVFRDVAGLMRNVQLVTDHLRARCRLNQSRDTTLTIIPARSGAAFVVDASGDYWRTFEFIEDTTSYDVCPNPAAAHQAAAILGRFQRDLNDLDPSLLVETIPGFHNAPLRFDALIEIAKKDPLGRAEASRGEIEFGVSSRGVAGQLIAALNDGSSKMRVTHNDMKLNNVLFEDSGTSAIALVDLDTCMPGSVLFDFGDFARNTSVPSDEDEIDHERIRVDLELFEAIASGYLEAFGDSLTAKEKELLVVAPRVLALTLGVRFLTDHLQGDTYFRIHRPGQNLDRARAQFAVAERFREAEKSLREIVGTG